MPENQGSMTYQTKLNSIVQYGIDHPIIAGVAIIAFAIFCPLAHIALLIISLMIWIDIQKLKMQQPYAIVN